MLARSALGPNAVHMYLPAVIKRHGHVAITMGVTGGLIHVGK
jgi:hypothetical protein